ncbi:EGF-like repeat and discoidin I-like domain-containing protein 3 [Mytilus californianus]|uniref:EGF-like repeat and discoidin I-like domain-containing protein 3 n=1 Tax=Mytilus californianus TaxID=6549 RepID=UPI0022474F0B|nr:EGF-like repeat and discoidin I-like domain-containing protein 3 [Mytilus californianus]
MIRTTQSLQCMIHLKRDYNITGVITQGRNGCCPQWVTQYRILYGNDCKNLKVLDSGNGTKFSGNSDQDTMATNMFKFPVTAKCIRILPTDWNSQISMRVEILGCPLMTTMSPSTTSSLTTVSPSTTGQHNIKDKGSVLVSYQPNRAFLNSQEETNKTTIRYMGGWSPAKSDAKPYIQVEFSDPTIITGLVTQGKNGCCNKWVTKYKISYSTDCKTWIVSGGGSGQIFKANTDSDTPVTNILLCPTAVKCLRIHPEESNNEIGMRFELIGCQIQNGGISASYVTPSVTQGNQVTVPPTSPSTQAISSAVHSVSVNQQQVSGL